jgi:hypothetical protein
MTGGNEWEAAYQKAKAFVGQLTLEEKVSNDDGHTKTRAIDKAGLARLTFIRSISPLGSRPILPAAA